MTNDLVSWAALAVIGTIMIWAIRYMARDGGWTQQQCESINCHRVGDHRTTRRDGTTAWRCEDHDTSTANAEWASIKDAIGEHDADDALAAWSTLYPEYRDHR